MSLTHARSAREARIALEQELEAVSLGQVREAPARKRFDDFAVSLLERKVLTGEIKSAKSRESWASILKVHLLPAFGHLFVDEIRRADIEDWRVEAARSIRTGTLSPHTANAWLRILRVILNTASAELELDRNPVLGVKSFDTSEHLGYTDEQPNSLTPDETAEFLRLIRARHPQHFALVALGFSTGLRPSSLRPLRRQGDSPDILWDEGVLLVRRSHTRRDEVMNTTKTKRHQRITLPPEMVEILRWHAERLPEGPMRDSELLFPSTTGGFRSTSGLDKPFRDVAEAMKLEKRITPKGMRRTFQDLARAAEVRDLVTRAVSGHATESMQRHYSTVQQLEIQAGLGKVIDLAGVRRALDATLSDDQSAGVFSASDVPRNVPGGVHGGAHGPKRTLAG